MFPFAVIAAVSIAPIIVQHCVVHHLPDAAADEIVVGVDLFPVIFHSSRPDAHGVRVFAEEVRPVRKLFDLVCLFAYLMDLRRRRVHLACDVVCLAFCVYRAFVVHRKRASFFDVVVHHVGAEGAAGFVPEAPHYYRCVSLISLVKMLRAVDEVRPPFRIVAYPVIAWRQHVRESAVRLKVCLVNYIYPKLVAHFEKIRVRRVVRSPDRVDIIFLAEPHVSLDLLRSQVISVPRARVVVVDAMELELFPVQREVGAGHFDVLEPYAELHCASRYFDVEVIKAWVFCCPFFHFYSIKNNTRGLVVCSYGF